MIGFLRGQVVKAGVVEAGGIGWSVHSPDPMEVGSDIVLHVTTIARDGSMALFGFVDPTDQLLFDALLRVARVGPAMAINILATFSPGELASVIQERDVDRLFKVTGVGRKSAETICSLMVLPPGIEAEVTEDQPAVGCHEVVATLVDLGFDERKADDAVRSILQGQPGGSTTTMGEGALDETTLLRQALSLLRSVP